MPDMEFEAYKASNEDTNNDSSRLFDELESFTAFDESKAGELTGESDFETVSVNDWQMFAPQRKLF